MHRHRLRCGRLRLIFPTLHQTCPSCIRLYEDSRHRYEHWSLLQKDMHSRCPWFFQLYRQCGEQGQLRHPSKRLCWSTRQKSGNYVACSKCDRPLQEHQRHPIVRKCRLLVPSFYPHRLRHTFQPLWWHIRLFHNRAYFHIRNNRHSREHMSYPYIQYS